MNKRLHFILLLCLGTCLCADVLAQTTVKGVIRDKKTGEKLIGATVAVKGTSQGASTNFDGEFTLKITTPLPVVLVASYIGYASQEVTVSNAQKPLDIRLAENTQQLRDVEIRDSRVTAKQKQAPLTVETMDALAIKETPAANFYEGLAHLKGVDLTSASIGFKIINTRGFNSTSPVRSLQLIDGVDNQSPGLNFSLGNFLGASDLDVQRVDLVVGASGAYYGPNAFNGVINMVTKSPFQFPGLSASVKAGERNLLEGAVRWAQVFKDAKGNDRFAYKANLFYMRADDWEATNYAPTEQSPTGVRNPGGYDAVNIYGDEFTTPAMFTDPTTLNNAGRGYYMREGYREIDLVDYKATNLKLGLSAHYKIKKDVELIYATNFGTGTTVYQGDNRFSLRDILFFQNRLEVRKENKFFVRAYATNEDAGNTYDIYSTAIIMQNRAKSDRQWGVDYNASLENNLGAAMLNWYGRNINGQGLQLDTIPGANFQRINYINNYWNTVYYDSLLFYHNIARNDASFMPSANGSGEQRLLPGTPEFQNQFNDIVSKTNQEGGSRFFDRSALYHIAGEYQFQYAEFDFRVGGNFRLYAPYSRGTIFLDTGSLRIYNREGGVYLGIERKVLKDHLKLSLTNRVDKNENFNFLWSPAATAVVVIKKHVFRVSGSSAIRNPTLTDQYINLNVGRATLLGNLNGFDSLVTIPSLLDAFNRGQNRLSYFNIDPIRPEEVKTIEFGYRASFLNDKLYLDINYYFSWYTHFIGYRIAADVDWQLGNPFPDRVNVYRVASNAKDQVTTQGFTGGIQYYIKKYVGINANYSWNVLDRGNSTDSIIPAFNTPEHKYNLGVNGRDFDLKFGSITSRHWGYSINYKYQTGFIFEGSPQFTGFVPAYDMVDFQVNKRIPTIKSTLKIGASNALNNKVFQVYGGPRVGRLIYASLLIELDTWK
ncbi:MAG: TonB-dependent receptor [Bacteroidia bacterium]|nr:TonB-dependent receptor [Bacteroidia bacterium]